MSGLNYSNQEGQNKVLISKRLDAGKWKIEYRYKWKRNLQVAGEWRTKVHVEGVLVEAKESTKTTHIMERRSKIRRRGTVREQDKDPVLNTGHIFW